MACTSGHLEIAKWLIKNGAEVDSRDNQRSTPLSCACAVEDNSAIVKLLLEKGAEVDARNKYGTTPFFIACDQSNLEIAKLLVSHGCDLISRDNQGLTVLHEACKFDNSEIAKFLIQNCQIDGRMKAFVINAIDNNGRTPLHLVSSKGYVGIAKMLIGCDEIRINPKDHNAWTPLHDACLSGHLEVVQVLLNGGVDTTAQARMSTFAPMDVTPLDLASRNSHFDVVWLMVSRCPWLVTG